MRLMALALVTVLALSGCQTTSDASESAEVRYTGGDGTSADTAVVISGPRNSMEGVPAEYAWIQRNLPGAKIESQSLVHGTKVYDVFEVTLPSGESRKVYFDISGFFGKRW